jgi:hypothetical protein
MRSSIEAALTFLRAIENPSAPLAHLILFVL